jgi:cell division protein FtsL
MLKKHLYRWIIIIFIFSSALGIYQQLGLLLNANKQIQNLSQKVVNLEKRNLELKKSLNP